MIIGWSLTKFLIDKKKSRLPPLFELSM